MKIKFKLKRKALLFGISLFEVFIMLVPSVLAFGYPSPSEVASKMEDRYHINKESIQNSAEYFNVAQNKSMAPQVTMHFDPANPKLAQKVTVSATPMYFGNSTTDQLYYTWYLKLDGCHSGSTDLEKCDADGNGLVNENDWKVTAARMIAGNGFDYKKVPERDYLTAEDPDKDGYMSSFGGNDQSRISSLGKDLVDKANAVVNFLACVANHDFTNDQNNGAVTGVVNGCATYLQDFFTGVEIQRILDGIASEMSDFPWVQLIAIVAHLLVTGDPGDAQAITDMLKDIALRIERGIYNAISDMLKDLYSQIPRCYIHDFTSGIDYEMVDRFGNDSSGCRHLFPRMPYPILNALLDRFHLPHDSFGLGNLDIFQEIFPNTVGTTGHFGGMKEYFFQTNPADPSTSDNGRKDEESVVGLGQSTFKWDYTPGDKVGVVVEGVGLNPTKYEDSSNMIMWALPKNMCDPLSLGHEGEKTVYVKGYSVKIPYIKMTAADINSCLEANLLDPTEGGQSAQMDVSLSYLPETPMNDPSTNKMGDQILINSAVLNARGTDTLKYAWEVFSNMDGNISNNNSWSSVTKESLGVKQMSAIGLKTFGFKLNLNENVKFIKVRLTVSANSGKTTELEAITTDQGTATIIIPIYSNSNKLHIFPAETADGSSLRLGATEICSQVSVKTNCDISTATTTAEITAAKNACQKAMEGVTCPVLKNDLIGISITDDSLANYSWTIDGKPIPPISGDCASGDCTSTLGENTGKVYIPILQEVGKKFVVALTADKNNGDRVSIVRNFEVVDPALKLVSTADSGAQAKLLGAYIDPLKNKDLPPSTFDPSRADLWDDFSDTDFLATNGSPLSFTVKTTPETLPLGPLVWEVDGQTVDPDRCAETNSACDTLRISFSNNNRTISFNADKNINETYTVSIGSVYTPSSGVKNFLYTNNGIPPDQFYEKQISDTIEIKMVEPVVMATAKVDVKKFFASIFASIPSHFIFLFRIVLTAILILFSAWLLFAFFPQLNEKHKH